MNPHRFLPFLAVIFGLVILIAAGGCGRATLDEPAAANPTEGTDDGDPSDVPLRRVADTPFEYSWDLALPKPVHRGWISPNVPELIFFQLVNGDIHAVYHRTGMTKWVSQEQMPALVTYLPYVTRTELPGERAGEKIFEDHMYVVSDDWLFCIDAVYGQLIYRYHLGRKGVEGFQPSTGPLVHGHGENARIFIGDWEGRVRVISWDAEKEMAYHKWQYNLYGTPTATPVGYEGYTYFGDRKGVLRAFALDRDVHWEFDATDPLKAPPAIRGRNLYVGGTSGVLHVLNRLSGLEITRLVLGAPVERQPFWFTCEPSRIYAWTGATIDNEPGLHAVYTMPDTVAYKGQPNKFPLEVERIKKEWFVGQVDKLVASSPEHLFLTKPDDPTMVYALDRQTGGFDWRWDLQAERDINQDGEIDEDEKIAQVIPYQDESDLVRSVFVVNGKGYIVAYRLFGQFNKR